MLSTKQLEVLEDDVEIPPQPQCPNVFPTKNLWEITEWWRKWSLTGRFAVSLPGTTGLSWLTMPWAVHQMIGHCWRHQGRTYWHWIRFSFGWLETNSMCFLLSWKVRGLAANTYIYIYVEGWVALLWFFFKRYPRGYGADSVGEYGNIMRCLGFVQ